MSYVLEVVDKSGKTIRLSKERWSHVQQDHGEVSLHDIEQTVTHPTKVTSSDRDGEVLWFYRYIRPKKQYHFVSVKYLNNHGFIITSHYATKIT